MPLPFPTNPVLKSLPVYQPGRPIEEVARELGLPAETVIKLASNENPLGPCKEGLEAIYKVAPLGGRYSPTGEAADFTTMMAEVEGVKPDYVLASAGSSPVLMAASCAFTSPTRSWITTRI